MGELTPRQQRFVEEYLIDLNATQAAIRAGYSEKTANEQGSQLLAKLSISDAVAAAQAERSKRTQITADRVLKEYAKLAFQDIRNVARWGRDPGDAESDNADQNGLGIYPVSLIPSEEVDDDTAAAVQEISLTQTGLKVKMHDKKGALDSIAKHLGMFVEKHEHSGAVEVHRIERRIVRDSAGE